VKGGKERLPTSQSRERKERATWATAYTYTNGNHLKDQHDSLPTE
jgi:hypothetical protein